MSVVLLAQAADNVFGSTLDLSLASRAGCLLTAVVQAGASAGGSPGVTSITDDAGNTWQSAVVGDGSNQRHVEIWYAENADAVTTVTVNIGSSQNLDVTVQAWIGAKLSLRGTNYQSVGSSASPAACTVPVKKDDLVLGGLAYQAASSGVRQDTADDGTALDDTFRGNAMMAASYLIADSNGATGPSWAMSPSVATSAVTAAFKVVRFEARHLVSGAWKRAGRPDIAALDEADLEGYTLIWRDEFDGDSVDTEKWNVRNGHVGGNESSICWAANVTVENSNLVIQPKIETTTSAGTTRSYTSGYLDTIGLFAPERPCFFIARMKLPLADDISGGMWPAFWLRDTSGLLGEIDVMEAWQESDSATTSAKNDSSKPEHRYLASTWANTNSATTGPTSGNRGWATTATVDLTEWHTYGVDIAEDGTCVFYFDGNPSLRADSAATYTYLPTAFSTYGIRLNLQVGQPAYWGDPDDDTDFSQQMLVDWVRVYTPN